MSAARTCPQCSAPLREDALEGLCPDCLGKLVLGAESEGQSLKAKGQSSGGIPAASEVGRDVPIAPPVSHLVSGHPLPSDGRGQGDGQRFGDYELLSEIAHGGMGVVFKARQVSLNRIVAVKMIRADRLAREEDIRRFRTEAQAAAQLQHPNIVAIHEVGEVAGQHFYCMDYVAGQSLSQVARERPLSPKQAARYVQKIAEAIHYAHQHGILHRDLKLSNVLIDEHDEPRVADFGLAKLMAGDSEMTLSGTVMGSPSYMPPEQARGRSREVTVRSDVYSLGAILYDVLCGRPPFRAETTLETLRQVLEMEPVLPRVLNPRAPRDLETIVLKCLQKEPAKRYSSAQDLAEELARFQRGEPIEARPVSAPEKLWRWCKRKPALAGTGAVAVLAVVLGLGGVLWQWRKSEGHRKAAEATVTRLEIDRAEMLFENGQSAEALAYLARVVRREPTNRVVGERIISALAHRNFCVPLFRLEHKADVTAAEFSPDGRRVLTASKDGTARLWDGRTGQPMLAPFQHADQVTAAHFSPDGARVVTTSLDKTARIWDAYTGQLLIEPLGHRSGVLCADFSPDGRRLVTGSTDGSMRLYDSATGALIDMLVQLNGAVSFIKFSPNGESIALASLQAGSGRIVQAADGKELATFTQPGGGYAVVLGSTAPFPSFSPDGKRVVTVPQALNLDVVWTAPARINRLRERMHTVLITCARFSPDGLRLATSSRDATARIWDADTGQPLGEVMRHGTYVNSIEFSPDGRQVVTGSKDRTARIWDARAGRPLSEPLRHDASVLTVRFSSDGQRVLSLCEGPMVWVWEVRCGQSMTPSLQHLSEVRRAVFSPDGERVATSTREEGHLCLWDTQRGVLVMPPFGSGHGGARFSADGSRLLAGSGQGVSVFDANTGKVVGGPFFASRAATENQTASFSPDGQLVLRGARVWRIDTGSQVAEFTHEGAVGFAQFSPDGRWVVTTSQDQTARLWDWRTSRALSEPLLHEGAVLWADVSTDSRRVVTISRDRTARIWEAPSGKLLHTLPHTEEPYHWNSVEFSPDGKLVVTAAGHLAQIWDSHSGQPVTAPLKHDERVNSVRFSPDGRLMVTAASDGAARIWDVATGHLVSEPLRHRDRVVYAEFSPESSRIVTASSDGTAQIWEVPRLSFVPPWVADWAEAVAGQRLNPRNASQPLPFEEVRRLREKLTRVADGGEAGRWAKWFFSDNNARQISPASVISVSQLAERRIQQGTLESLEQAVRLSPTNALAQARLALLALTNETAPSPLQMASSDWQSLHACRLAPHDPEVLWARAEVCDRLGRLADALQTMERAISLGPTNPAFWNAWGLLLEKTNRVEEALQAYSKAAELAGPWLGARRLPALAWRNRSNLLKRLGQPAEARADYLKSVNISARAADTPPHLIDLSPYYNRGLELTGEYFFDFTRLPTGRATLAGIEFDIRGAIQLSAGLVKWDIDTPESVLGIAIGRKCSRLHFLHFGCNPPPIPFVDGATIGLYRMRYVDGHQREMPIVYGHHVRDESPNIDPKDPIDPGTRVGWVGTTPDHRPIRLFLTAWDNPHPDVAIESLDFITSSNRVIPFLFAITAEP